MIKWTWTIWAVAVAVSHVLERFSSVPLFFYLNPNYRRQ